MSDLIKEGVFIVLYIIAKVQRVFDGTRQIAFVAPKI